VVCLAIEFPQLVLAGSTKFKYPSEGQVLHVRVNLREKLCAVSLPANAGSIGREED
jgi:hypothetical protein